MEKTHVAQGFVRPMCLLPLSALGCCFTTTTTLTTICVLLLPNTEIVTDGEGKLSPSHPSLSSATFCLKYKVALASLLGQAVGALSLSASFREREGDMGIHSNGRSLMAHVEYPSMSTFISLPAPGL